MSLFRDIITIIKAAPKIEESENAWAEVTCLTSVDRWTLTTDEHEHVFTREGQTHLGEIEHFFPTWGITGCLYLCCGTCSICRVVQNRLAFRCDLAWEDQLGEMVRKEWS